MEYAYRLAPYKGKASRLTCPNCNRPHCFSPYVDDAGNVLDPTVGRCDHESSCAYHKTPADYFKEHPELREPDWRWQRPPQLQSTPKQRQIAPAPAKPANYLPDDIVRRTLRLNPRSFLLQFLQTLFDEQTIVRLVSEYRIGVTKDLSAIFYQGRLSATIPRLATASRMPPSPWTGCIPASKRVATFRNPGSSPSASSASISCERDQMRPSAWLRPRKPPSSVPAFFLNSCGWPPAAKASWETGSMPSTADVSLLTPTSTPSTPGPPNSKRDPGSPSWCPTISRSPQPMKNAPLGPISQTD